MPSIFSNKQIIIHISFACVCVFEALFIHRCISGGGLQLFQAAMPGKLKLLNVDVSLSLFLYLIFVHKFNYLLGQCIIIILELLHETEVILPALRGEGDGHAPGA